MGLGLQKDPTKIRLHKSLTLHQLHAHICAQYPGIPLTISGYHLAVSTKRKVLKRLEFAGMQQLRADVGRGKLYIIPKRDLAQTQDDMDSRWPSSSSDSGSEFQEFPECPWNSSPERSQRASSTSVTATCTTVTASSTSNSSPERSRRASSTSVTATCTTVTASSTLERLRREERQRESIQERLRLEERERESRRVERMLQLRESRARELAEEPDNGIRIKFRTSGGRSIMRRFSPGQSAKAIVNFVGSLEEATENFEVLPPNGPPLNLSASSSTIQDLGLIDRTVLNVKWLADAPAEGSPTEGSSTQVETPDLPDLHVDTSSAQGENPDTGTNEVVFEDLGTPTVAIRRPCRDAAAVARVRVLEWVNDLSGSARNAPPPVEPATPTVEPSSSADKTLPSPDVHVRITDEEFTTELDTIYNGEEDNRENSAVGHGPTGTLPIAFKLLATVVLGNANDGNLKIIVRRSSALTDALQNIARAQSRLMQPLAVRFIAEPAVDEGGPSRELSSEVVKQITQSQFIEGEDKHLKFRHDYKLHVEKKYQYLGQLIAVLLLQGGQGLPVFSQTVVQYIATATLPNCTDDLPESIRKAFGQLEKMSEGEFSSNVDNLLPERFEAGYAVPCQRLKKDDLQELVEAMVSHYVIQPQKMALDQFMQGLQIGGVLETLQAHPDEAKKLFVSDSTVLTMDVLEDLLKFNYDSIPLGSNKMRIAQAIEQGFIFLLQAAESGEAQYRFNNECVSVTLGDILMWLTGASRVPAIGLSKKVDIHFFEEALPRVNTCSLETYLPLLARFECQETATRQLVEWIFDSQGFGQV